MCYMVGSEFFEMIELSPCKCSLTKIDKKTALSHAASTSNDIPVTRPTPESKTHEVWKNRSANPIYANSVAIRVSRSVFTGLVKLTIPAIINMFAISVIFKMLLVTDS